MKVTTVRMPGMFNMVDDWHPDHDTQDGPYQPMSYALGDPCLRCWIVGSHLQTSCSGWGTYNLAIRPVGGIGCPHGDQP